MARISGIDLPNKQISTALTYIHGIGRSLALKICMACDIDPVQKIADLSADQTNMLRKYIDNNCIVEGRLRTSVSMAIKRLVDIRSYRGIRHTRGLPVRGQRTQTNARTRKGKRKTVAGKKK